MGLLQERLEHGGILPSHNEAKAQSLTLSLVQRSRTNRETLLDISRREIGHSVGPRIVESFYSVLEVGTASTLSLLQWLHYRDQ